MGQLRDRMQEDMVLRGLRETTQCAYLDCAQKFAAYYRRSPADMGGQEIRAYLLYLLEERELRPSSIGVHIGALKFLYKVTLDRPEEVSGLVCPKRRQRLPDVLTAGEVELLLTAGRWVEHRAAILVAYGAGLRAAEVCRLHSSDIDRKQMLIHVRDGKGGKDRYTLLSESLLKVLRWLHTKSQRYLFPVRVLSTLFRAKFLRALRRAFAGGTLRFPPSLATLAERDAFNRCIDSLYQQEWVVYAKRPFGGADQVFDDLGRYTHRVAISNQRLKAIDHHRGRFHTREGNTVTLTPAEFIRRFLWHVLPAGFTKIRHYGLLAPAHACTRLEHARTLLHDDLPTRPSHLPAAQTDWRGHLVALGAADLLRCPRCEVGSMLRHPLPPAPRAIPDG